eukprot:7391776-Prymnesium_polylepis.1
MSPQPRSLPDNCSSRQVEWLSLEELTDEYAIFKKWPTELDRLAVTHLMDMPDLEWEKVEGDRFYMTRAQYDTCAGERGKPFECTPYSNGPIGISEWAIGGGRCSTCYILTRGAHGPRTPAPRLNAHPPPAACRPAALARWVDLTPAVWVPQVQCANMSSGSARRCLSSQHV